VALEIVYQRRALKDLRHLPPADRLRVLDRVEAYAADPDNPRHPVLALVGAKPTCRLRVGDWRVLFDRIGDKTDVRGVRHRARGLSMSSDTTDTNSIAREMEELEDQLDVALLKLARMEQANDESVPGDMVRRLVEGGHPLTDWREHRGLTREVLAELSRTPIELLSEIENGKEDVPLRTMNAVARALGVDLDDLVPWTDDAEGLGKTSE
jgi:mRNA-degrading endonuclease RelE of RelBE toxin-antitoxin system/DNA-binding Xre family transcriptional regulator